MGGSLFTVAPVFASSAQLFEHYRDVRQRLLDAPPCLCRREPLYTPAGAVFAVVCAEFGTTRAQVQADAEIRAIAAYLLREHTRLRWFSIGRLLGRSASTVLTAHAGVSQRMVRDPAFAERIMAVRKQIAGLAHGRSGA